MLLPSLNVDGFCFVSKRQAAIIEGVLKTLNPLSEEMRKYKYFTLEELTAFSETSEVNVREQMQGLVSLFLAKEVSKPGETKLYLFAYSQIAQINKILVGFNKFGLTKIERSIVRVLKLAVTQGNKVTFADVEKISTGSSIRKFMWGMDESDPLVSDPDNHTNRNMDFYVTKNGLAVLAGWNEITKLLTD